MPTTITATDLTITIPGDLADYLRAARDDV
jgi:hypothetical protein